MKKLIPIIASGIILALALETAALESNLFFGTWRLNTTKCKVSDPRMLPMTQIITSKGAKNGSIRVRSDIVDGDGREYHTFWEGKYDGNDYPITGWPAWDTCAYTRIEFNTFVVVNKKYGKAVSRFQYIVSKDGKRVDCTGQLKDTTGRELAEFLVYDKLED
jgi:hypothetical protein